MYEQLGVDYDELLVRFPREAFIKKYLVMFSKDENFSTLGQAVKTHDYENVLRAAHTIKGLARNLEFVALFQSSMALVECVRAGNTEDVERLYGCVEADYEDLFAMLERVI